MIDHEEDWTADMIVDDWDLDADNFLDQPLCDERERKEPKDPIEEIEDEDADL